MCGVLGISCSDCKNQVFSKLMTCGNDLCHRGEQGWGIATSDSEKISCHHQEGRLGEGITEERARELAKKQQGYIGLAHTLYSTTGLDKLKKQHKYFQPSVASFNGKPFALVFNGNIYDFESLKQEAKSAGWKFASESSDTEVIVSLIAISSEKDIIEALKKVLPKLIGAFSLIVLYDGKIIGIRDRFGIKPLCIGYSNEGFFLSSESCVFYPLGAKHIREVRPGEIVVINKKGIERYIKWTKETSCRFCIFEFIYFGRPDSLLCQNRSGYYYRNQAGMLMAKQNKVDADLIISAPAGGDIFAEAYASALGIPLRQGLFKNRFGIRTFMAERGTDRRALQRKKLHPLEEVIRGKRICIAEDSIVRNSVAPEIALMCYEAGAREVHIRVFSAPIRHPCFYGVDMATKEELAAANLELEEIREQIGADSLEYLTIDNMIRATGLNKEDLCLACFDGNYPVAPPRQ
jgi:amidophosphoribosyltransferase